MILQFVAFAAVGGVGTACHYALLVTLVMTLDADPTVAATAGFLLGMIVNYVLNHRYTFRSANPHQFAAPRFFAIGLAGILLNGIIVFCLHEVVGLHYLVAQAMATGGLLMVNFLANRFWTFGAVKPAESRSEPNP